MKKEELLELIIKKPIPSHVALILDGNGRWATSKGLPRNLGHEKGAKTLVEIAKVASELGIKYLTAFVFSTENWSRPKEEVNFIMQQIIKICNDYKTLVKNNIKLVVIGSKDNVPNDVSNAINEAVINTSICNGMTLNMAFNYGSHNEIVEATKNIAKQVKDESLNIDDIDESIIESNLYTKGIPSVDLLIRTSGELRISNYLLWQIAYAELYFTKTYWPDFHKKEFLEAIYEYQSRNRRFGGLEKK